MKKLFKSALSLLLALSMMLGSVTVFAADEDYAATSNLPTGEDEMVVYEDLSTEVPEAVEHIDDMASSYWAQFSTSYYYNLLPADLKTVWAGIDAQCSAMLEQGVDATFLELSDGSTGYFTPYVASPRRLTSNEQLAVLRALRYSNPQYYFLDSAIVYRSAGGTYYYALEVFPAFASGSTRAPYTQQFKAVTDAWLAQINMAAAPEQKEKQIHDIITSNITYVANTYDQSAFSALCLGQTVCAGYTMTVQLLGRAAGLDVIPVTGYVTGGRHAWNKINLHGVWYVLDTTWDDSAASFRYYNKSDADGGYRDPDTDLAAYVPESPYSMTGTSSYLTGYFMTDGILYFSIDGADNFFAWALDTDVTAPHAVPATTARGNVGYVVAGADSGAKIKTFVIRLYDIILGRRPDAEGHAAWSNALLTGSTTSAATVYGLVNGAEFTARGYSNAQIVEKMYQAMLGRNADEAGKANWVSCLDIGMTVASIVNGFSSSAEFAAVCANYGMQPGAIAITEARDINGNVTKFVSRCYKEGLGRTADMQGLNVWCGALIGKSVTPQQVASQFALSAEVAAKNLTNDQFVEMCYKLCMGRVADASGMAYWSNLLSQGYTRESVLNAFAYSQEFAIIVAGFGL